MKPLKFQPRLSNAVEGTARPSLKLSVAGEKVLISGGPGICCLLCGRARGEGGAQKLYMNQDVDKYVDDAHLRILEHKRNITKKKATLMVPYWGATTNGHMGD